MALELRIASPCEEKWESMQGDERVRFCARCSLNVFNIKELTEVEVRALFLKAEGRVCGRVFRRRDGTVLTRDCPTGLAKLRKRALAGLTLAVSLVLAVIGFRMSAGKKCDTGTSSVEGWFSRVIEQRFIDARETLRETKTFGPIIDELYPQMVTAGAMVAMPPPPPPSPQP